MASDSPAAHTHTNTSTNTRSTRAQYDLIGAKYNAAHTLAAAQPEAPSAIQALGHVKGKRCLDLACGTGRYTHLLHTLGATSVTAFDISPAMIESAKAAYPPDLYPTLSFSVADCSKPIGPLTPGTPYDTIFAGWFLNYASSESELDSMFSTIALNLAPDGVFVGITTNGDAEDMRAPKEDFYGLDVKILDPAYKDPGGEVLGIKTKVVFRGMDVAFECFVFEKKVYERCARRQGLDVRWWGYVLPEGEGGGAGEYWAEWLNRPTFSVLSCSKLGRTH